MAEFFFFSEKQFLRFFDNLGINAYPIDTPSSIRYQLDIEISH